MRVDIGIFLILFLVYLIIRCFMLVARRKKRKKNYIGKEVMNALLVGYIIFLVSITIWPDFRMLDESISLLEAFKRIRWIPLYDFYLDIKRNGIETIGRFFLESFFGNMILLTPIISYICCYNRKIRSVKNIIIVSFLMSLSIETIQFFENIFLGTTRSIDASDLLLNTISGLIGYVIFKVLYKTKLSVLVRVK